MGYGDEQGQLVYIAQLARELADMLGAPNVGGHYPPQRIVDEMRPLLHPIADALITFKIAIEEKTPREPISYDTIYSWIGPESVDEVHAISNGNGLFIKTSPTYNRRIEHPELGEAFEPSLGDGISVAVYVDSGSQEKDFYLVQDVET